MSKAQIFSAEEIAAMRHGGQILRACLNHTAAAVKPGVSTGELDAIAETFIRDHEGATPAFKGYHGFSGTLCTSVNEQCVHGVPGERTLDEGDIISIDCGVLYEDLYTDACVTAPVGAISEEAEHLLQVTQEALEAALAIVKTGTLVGDISATVQNYAQERGCAAIPSLTGHGLGKTLHQFPDIPNVGEAGTGYALPKDTIVAVEPILCLGDPRIETAKDGWTISMRDGAYAAHFEHTVLITDNGVEIIA